MESASPVTSTFSYTWSPCPLSLPPGIQNYALDCLSLVSKYNYSLPFSAQNNITISLARLTPTLPTNQTQTGLLILPSTAGMSGWHAIQDWANYIPDASMGVVLLFPDQRGSGLSQLLACDATGNQTISPSCITYLTSTYGANLATFTISNAAHDISLQIAAVVGSYAGGIGVSIYSSGYGTRLHDRFLHFYSSQSQHNVMDGVQHPALASSSMEILYGDGIARIILTQCDYQPSCHQYFQPENTDVMYVLSDLLSALDNGQLLCAALLPIPTSSYLRNLVFQILADSPSAQYRVLLPSLILRLQRCAAEDQAPLSAFFAQISALVPHLFGAVHGARVARSQLHFGASNASLLFSHVLNMHLVQSELWLSEGQAEIDSNTVTAWYYGTVAAQAFPGFYISWRATWPRYPLDPLTYIASNGTVSMLVGDTDIIAPLSHAQQLQSERPGRTLITVPLASHPTLSMSAFYNSSCTQQSILSLLVPSNVPSSWGVGCIQGLPDELDYSGGTVLTQQISLLLFNFSQPFIGLNTDYSTPTPSAAIYALLALLLVFIALFALMNWAGRQREKKEDARKQPLLSERERKENM